jgi:hypothetical protein
VQVVQAFNPYPQQATDVAYGSSVSVTSTALVANGAAAKALIPTVANGGSSLADAWRGLVANEPFDDAGWTSGTTAVGFPNAGVATTNLKLRLNANDGATLVTDTRRVTAGRTISRRDRETTDLNGRTRHGALHQRHDSNGTATGDQVIVPALDFSVTTGTIMFWIKTAGNVADGGNVGAMPSITDPAPLPDRDWFASTDAGNLRIQPRTSGGALPNTLRA